MCGAASAVGCGCVGSPVCTRVVMCCFLVNSWVLCCANPGQDALASWWHLTVVALQGKTHFPGDGFWSFGRPASTSIIVSDLDVHVDSNVDTGCGNALPLLQVSLLHVCACAPICYLCRIYQGQRCQERSCFSLCCVALLMFAVVAGCIQSMLVGRQHARHHVQQETGARLCSPGAWGMCTIALLPLLQSCTHVAHVQIDQDVLYFVHTVSKSITGIAVSRNLAFDGSTCLQAHCPVHACMTAPACQWSVCRIY